MATSSLKNKKILITCGPTWVSLDSVRVISNQSSGQLGHILARDLHKAGARVTVLEGPVQTPLTVKGIKVLKFSFFDELFALLKKELSQKYTAVIHAAAVADYQPAKKFSGKIDSDLAKMQITLVRTPKLINIIKAIRPKIFLTGFKLEPRIDKNKLKKITKKLFKNAHCNLVVANSLNKKNYSGYIVNNRLQVLAKVGSRQKLSQRLVEILKEKICTDFP
ncbi:MAG: hypothetical protein A2787_00305 [Omnitrophica WOR_2 bacterium RIFCSPHIGHO2_01_FULL_48_9]|nr:MAG: hypothetical protein A3D10_06515 [Omnitrophica WOR_2 bacterium RIFCSPHIGHO2_02_FULL_48_11]OGX33092.1 MAG: hypothetical protein A2787_00305 [Omnitrophica WOR_2 bacterium RIFCSPHIGHO2_01_FULL_48_9]